MNGTKVFADTWYLIGGQRRYLPGLLVAAIILGFLDLVGIGLIAPFIATLSNPESSGRMTTWVLERVPYPGASPVIVMGTLLIAVFAARLLGSVVAMWAVYGFSAKLDHSLRMRLLRTYFAMDAEVHAARDTAYLVNAVHSFSAQFSYGFVATLVRVAIELIICIAILVFTLWVNPLSFFLLTLLLAGVYVFYKKIIRQRAHIYGQRVAEASAEMIRELQQGMAGLKEIAVYGISERLLSGSDSIALNHARSNHHYLLLLSVPRYLIEFSAVLFICATVFLLIASGMPDGELIPVLGMLGASLMRLVPGLNYAMAGATELRFGQTAIERLAEDLKRGEKTDFDMPASSPLLEPFKVLELRGVTYQHPGSDKAVLQGVSLTIRAGESIGIVGPSGGGKTTLAELVVGLREPTSGMVLLNGQDRRSLNPINTRGYFAYLPQEIFILNDTIRNNVSLRDEAADAESRSSAAIASARLDSVLDDLPNGIDSFCGEGGARLSGGQKQRIAVARAFYHRRSVLVLDEATSALDQCTEREIISEIQELKGSCTLFVVAHRLQTVLGCDRIFVVKEGRISEISKEQLLAEAY